jgi:type IV pilus assembly protein PilB
LSTPPKAQLAAFDPANYAIDPKIVKLVSIDIARKYKVLALGRIGASLQVAMVDPNNYRARDDLKFITGFDIEPLKGDEAAILEAIEYAYNIPEPGTSNDGGELTQALGAFADDFDAEDDDEGNGEEESSLADLEAAAEGQPIVRLVNVILSEAVKAGASDVHLEPYEKEYRVRLRVDGILQELMKPPLKLRDAMISRIKILARLDISEKRLPQDGRIMIRMRINGRRRQLDWRVSSLPTLWGEKIVMRLLDKDNLRLDMTQLGFEPESLEKFQAAITKPFGMVLVTGPTGSGKTNTLYSAISLLNKPDTNIMTAEDPVEFQLQGVNQVQMKEQIGLNFAAALRSFLRQDPNIILVGEIRDFETAEIAIKAALTGHLVLSTLHTNGAPETVSRLMNMGIEPFLVATSVHLIVAQRLIRRICTNCIQPVEVPPQVLLKAGFTQAEARTVKVMKGRGCEKCNSTGYKGRTALYEVMEVDDNVRELILVGASSLELKKKAVENGMITLRRSGLRKIMLGQTTMEEVLRETVS